MAPEATTTGVALVFMQIRAMVWKDLLVMAAHRRRAVSEVMAPAVTSCIFCLLVVIFGRDVGFIGQFLSDTYSVADKDAVCDIGEWSSQFMGATPPQTAYRMGNASSGFVCPRENPAFFEVPSYNNVADLHDAWQSFAGPVVSNGNWPEGIAFVGDTHENRSLYYSQFNYNSRSLKGIVNATLSYGSTSTNEWSSPLWTGIMGYNSDAQLFNYNFFQIFATAGAFVLCCMFVALGTNTAGRLVDEKRTKVREHLKVMGVKPFSYLLANLTTAFIRVFIACVTVSIVLFSWATKLYPATDVIEIVLIMLLYGLSVCAFATIMPAIVTKTMISNAMMSFFVTFGALGGVFVTTYKHIGPQLVVGLFFSPASAVYGIAQIAGFRGCTLPISPGMCVLLLFWNIFFYAALGEYLYAINPGDYGVPKHPLFPIHAVLELVGARKKSDEGADEDAGALLGDEQSPPTTSPIDIVDSATGAAERSPNRIVMDGLTKYFGTQRDEAAVNDLSLSIRNGEIFALLGHNGAGKTTTISMLIGMIPATHYRQCTIEGYDIGTQMDDIRRSIACCPQFDVLYDDLSGKQHLELYAAIKGVRSSRAAELLNDLHLPLTDQKASTFSGGMKRRLSVGMALVGGSNVLFLDEPSSGLDPLSRRQLWALLKQERERGKTIVLTTHFMEEADYLGDRIAIMSHGKLVCCDTSTGLKQNHGVGYYLSVVKDPDAVERGQQLDTAAILAQCNRFCDGQATLHNETNSDAVFLLPTSALDSYGDLLEWLEQSLMDLHASSYGIAMNSLDDVFVAISEQQDALRQKELEAAGKAKANQELDTSVNDAGERTHDIFAESSATSPWSLLLSNIGVLCMKKAFVWRRTPRIVVWSNIAPTLFALVAYFAAIPNFFQNGDAQPVSFKAPTARPMPDMHRTLSVLVLPGDLSTINSNGVASTGTAQVDNECVDAVLGQFKQAWEEYRQVIYEPVMGPLNFDVVRKHLLVDTGAWVNLHSISWIAQTGHPAVLAINRCSNKNFDRESGEPFEIDFSWMYDSNNLDPKGLYLYDTLLQSGLRRLGSGVAHEPPVPMVRFTPFSVPIPTITTSPDTPPPTRDPHHKEHAPYQEYFVASTGVLLIVGLAQFSATVALQVADELDKGTFGMLRVHGMLASGYWLGNFCFDIMSASPLMLIMLLGPWIRGIKAMQNNCTWSLNFFTYLWLMMFGIFGGYAIVAALPRNLKHSTYIAAVYIGNVLMMALPFAILGIVIAATDGKTNPIWLAYSTPQRAFMMVLMMQDDQPFHDPECAWTRDGTAGKAFISFACWSVIPLLTLVYQSHWDLVDRLFSASSSSSSQQRGTGEQQPLTGAAGAPGSPAGAYMEPGGAANGSTLPVDADEDVVREYDRVTRELHQLQNGISSLAPVQVVTASDTDDRAAAAALPTAAGEGPTTDAAQKPHRVMSAAAAASHEVDMYLVKDLRKVYSGGLCGTSKTAVETLSFGLKRGECFGLLGPNGAGKTTTVKMMLREHVMTSGLMQAPYAPAESTTGTCLSEPSRGAIYRGARLGVCPQHDALWDQLNAEEHVHLFLWMRLGPKYRRQDWDQYVKRSLAKVQLSEGGDKASEKFSGGMKRKLLVCIAMYTGAATVFLDEPSTGMDPHARRALWRSIHEALEDDRCVLLTTHSMDEADSVCARIAIVTEGLMRCIGSGQHLKNRYGSGYAITLTLKPTPGAVVEGAVSIEDQQRGAKLDQCMFQAFGNTCTMKEALGLQRKYSVSVLPSVAQAFRILARSRNDWGLESYSVTQMTSLEQIFLDFAGAAANLDGN